MRSWRKVEKIPSAELLTVIVFAVFPFVSFLNHNRTLLSWEPKIVAAALATLLLAVAGAAALKLFARRTAFAVIANVVAIGLIFAFNYGAFDLFLKSAGVVRHSQALLVWSAATLLVLSCVWYFRAGRGLSIFLLVTGLSALGLAGGQLLVYRLGAGSAASMASVLSESPALTQGTALKTPDVYYILLDTYARADVLRDVAGFDNRPFVSELEKRGFYVADRSNSNYPITTLSLSSTLSMDYLVTRTGRGTVGHHQRYNVALGGINRTVAEFRRLGYRYVHVQSEGWRASWCLGQEDVCLKGKSLGSISETEVGMLRKTPLYPFFLLYLKDLVQYARFSLDDLAQALPPAVTRPSFLFYHNLDVHGRTFDAGCRPIPRERLDFAAAFDREVSVLRNALRCVNGQVMNLVDVILAVDPDAIIIFQGDHGLRLGAWPDFEQWSEADLFNRFGILNAMRIPEPCRKHLYPSISSVNTFRVVFACLKGEPPELLEDQSYWVSLDSERVEFWRKTVR